MSYSPSRPWIDNSQIMEEEDYAVNNEVDDSQAMPFQYGYEGDEFEHFREQERVMREINSPDYLSADDQQRIRDEVDGGEDQRYNSMFQQVFKPKHDNLSILIFFTIVQMRNEADSCWENQVREMCCSS